MPFNGVGVFTGLTPPTYPAVTGTVIDAGYFNSIMQDIFSGLTNAVTRNGQSPATANLPMNGFKHTGCSDGTAPDEYATFGQLQALVSGGVIPGADYNWTGSHLFDPGNTGNPAILGDTGPSVRIVRTSPSGGLGTVRAPFIIDHKASADTDAFEWSLVVRNSNYADDTAENVAIYGQAYKYHLQGNSFAGVFEAKDFSGNSGTGILCALELDLFGNGSAGVASRVGAQLVLGKADTGLAQFVARAGIEIAPQGDDKSVAKLTNAIDIRANCDGALFSQSNLSTAAYAFDFLDGGGVTHFIRFDASKMAAYQAVGSGGSLGTYAGRVKININGATKWFPVYE
jgi:hypothetical protein